MDKYREPVLQGILSSPKYLPTWYQYDEAGSKLFEEAAYDNPFYYIYKSEWPVLEQNKHEMMDFSRSPHVYMDLGCGRMKKSRIIIQTLLEKQETLVFYPVDISEQILKEASDQLANDFGTTLKIYPVLGDFSAGFELLRSHRHNQKFITCLGGTLQILPYDEQVTLLQKLSDAMSGAIPDVACYATGTAVISRMGDLWILPGTPVDDNDSFLLTMDITNVADAVKKAYLGEDGKSGFTQVYRNLFLRLNREFDTNIDPDTFEFEGQFTNQKDRASFFTICARSKIHQSHVSTAKLPTPLTLERGEYIRLSSSESISYKYTMAQIHVLAGKGGMRVQQIWKSQNGHIACVLLKKISQPK